MKHVLLTVVLALQLGPAVLSQSVIHELPGPPDGHAGPVAGRIDVDGDGRDDVIVGMPGDDTGAADAGSVRAFSGATGQQLWLRYGIGAGDGLGAAVATCSDRNADGVRDVVAGAPNARLGGVRPGCAMLLCGASGVLLGLYWGDADGDQLGFAVTGEFDWNLDGTHDLAAGAPEWGAAEGAVKIWDGASGNLLTTQSTKQTATRFGYAVCSLGDWSNDGFDDLAISAPFQDGAQSSGFVYYFYAGGANFVTGQQLDEGFGMSLARGPDLDQNGVSELLIGAPRNGANGTWSGSVYAARQTLILNRWDGTAALDQLGSSVARIDDVDGDGIGEVVAGAPGVLKPGYARVISPAGLGSVLFDVTGSATHQEVGAHVADLGDVNGDGAPDFGVGDPAYPMGPNGSETGRVLAVSGGCPGFARYCTAGTSASGCKAALSATGVPSAVLPLPFQLVATGVEGAKDGLFFFGWNGRQANAWGNGTSYQCVAPPVKRGGLLAATGTPGACDGAFSQDLNVLWQANPQKNPGIGAVVQAQLWYRDPQNTSNRTTSLSDALEFVVCP